MSQLPLPPSAAGRFITAKLGKDIYRAFVPYPLPPTLEWDLELSRILSDADRALGELSGLARRVSTPPRWLHFPFIRREAVLSSRIEGTRASLSDLYAYEARRRRPGLAKVGFAGSDVAEVANYVVALEYGLDRLRTLPVSLRLIRELYERLMREVRGERERPGEFRTRQNWIGPPDFRVIEATFVPPPVQEMHEALDALEKYLHAEDPYPPLVRLAFIHYQFEAIHPFLDGNGRVGRLLISLLLVHWGLLSLPLLYLSAYLERRRDEYLSLLLAVSEEGAWREWVAFFLHGVAEQARDALGRAQRLQDLETDWRKRLLQGRSSAAMLQMVFQSPVLTVPMVSRELGVTYRAARLNIQKLVAAGLLEPHARYSNPRVFVAEEILRTIEGEP